MRRIIARHSLKDHETLNDHDLSQLDEEEFLNLPEEVLRCFSIKLLNDLKEARERLNQNSRNSPRPPSSEAPWEKEVTPDDTIDEVEEKQSPENEDENSSNPLKDSDQVPQQTEENEPN